ncbi:helix-turn-helix transcriptional regulator [Wenzhouxiangella sp. XN201]|uniref:winged helix-turn-helix transcriptional regulator n=1 Tax=Wenzhouxiangella sp. XN201 TaxID=2710755 RepID=UPI0013CB90E0|nr:helix-turn-helix domain-containing protein [Wenzhouxiangella sp. XN201]NEZ04929.1 helix-turn-helix transcriptional regulator [Wenzhouxiangella sp. XN201]
MRRGYGQYCPLALAAEILCRRWTVLVISRVLDGCRTFNEIHRGLPRISPSTLTQRLEELTDAGLISRRPVKGGRGHVYEPTEAGRDLSSIIDQMAVWGQHWARDMNMDDLDPGFLAWSMHMRINRAAMPPGRTVLHFEFDAAPPDCRRFWLVCTEDAVDMCLKDPGFETDLVIQAELLCFVECWRGFRDLKQEIRRGNVRLTGPRELKQAFPDWLQLSSLSPYPRKRDGRERKLIGN